MPKYYEVPPEVVEHYPSLIDDYIRAGTASMREDEYDPWEDAFSRAATGFAQGFQGIVGDYIKRDSEDRQQSRLLQRESNKQFEMQERQDFLARQKQELEDTEVESNRSRIQKAMQEFYSSPEAMTGDFMGAFARLARENPSTAAGVMDGLGNAKGAMADFLKLQLGGLGAKRAETAETQGARRLDISEAGQAQRGEQFVQREARLVEQMDALEKHRAQLMAMERAGLDVQRQKLAIQEENAKLSRELNAARIQNLQARTNKTISEGSGAGGKTLTALQATQRRAWRRMAMDELGPDASAEDIEARTDYYVTMGNRMIGSETGLKIGDDPNPITTTTRKPTNLPPPPGGRGPNQASPYQRTVERLNQLSEISEEGVATLRENMRRFTPQERQALERILATKPIKKRR